MTDLMKVDLGTDLVEASLTNDREEYPIFRLGGNEIPATGREENTLYAGDEIGGEFLGTNPMFSTEPKENWDEQLVDGKKIWVNKHYAFKKADGTLFGLFATSTLWKLQKIATSATNPSIKNPMVKVSYIGLVEGKEVLKEQYGVEITSGNKAHVCKLAHSRDAKISEYTKGCVNLLRSPKPTFGEKSNLSAFEQDVMNFEKAHSYATENGQVAGQLSM